MRKQSKICPECQKVVDMWCAGGSVTDPGPKIEGILTVKAQYEKVYHKACWDIRLERLEKEKKKGQKRKRKEA